MREKLWRPAFGRVMGEGAGGGGGGGELIEILSSEDWQSGELLRPGQGGGPACDSWDRGFKALRAPVSLSLAPLS